MLTLAVATAIWAGLVLPVHTAYRHVHTEDIQVRYNHAGELDVVYHGADSATSWVDAVGASNTAWANVVMFDLVLAADASDGA